MSLEPGLSARKLDAPRSATPVEHDSLVHENMLNSFFSGAWSSIKQPVDGARQLAGNTDVTPDSDSGFANKAGHFLGSAALYIGTTQLLSHLPGKCGRWAPMTAGGTLGFLQPLAASESFDARLANAGLGLGTAGALQFGPTGLAKLGMHNKLGQVALSNIGVGAANVNLDALIHTGHTAGVKETALNGGIWGLTGVGMHGLATKLGTGGTDTTAVERTGDKEKTAAALEREKINPLHQNELAPGFWSVNLQDQGINRRYDLYLPKGFDANKPSGVMMMLDGISPKTEGTMAFETQFNRHADAGIKNGHEQVAVLYPYAMKNRKIPLGGQVYAWNEPGAGLTPAQTGYSDFKYLDNVLKDVQSRLTVDPKRINGAAFSEAPLTKYASERPGLFSGIGLIHNTMNGSEAPLPHPSTGKVVPQDVVIVHSRGDYMLPYNGGRGPMTLFLPQAADSKPYMQAEYWGKTVNNSVAPPERISSPLGDQIIYTANDGKHNVVEYVLNSKYKHAWDGSPSKGWPLVGRPRSDFDTSSIVWDSLVNGNIARSVL